MCYFGGMEKNYHDLFSTVSDPRVQGRCLHKLSDILFIALCTLTANGDDSIDMVSFGLEREEWLRQIIELPNGIPSDDTFRRVLQMIEPEGLIKVLERDGQSFLDNYKDKLINIDGKKIKGVNPKSRGNHGLFILSAWVSDYGICIGQEKVADKSNEITAIPKLLDKIDVAGSTISIDAIGCQSEIAADIVSKDADYLLALKLNQKNLAEQIEEAFTHTKHTDHAEQWEYGHGRYETRSCTTLPIKDILSPDLIEKWSSAKQAIRVTATRVIGDISSTRSRYYLSSHDKKSAMQFNAMVRKHWSIENQLHWHLDVTFNEDTSRVRTKNSAENMNILRKMALQIVKRKTDKSSFKKRRFRASLNADYLTELLLA